MRRDTACKVNHPIFARFYARLSSRMDEDGVADRREQLLSGLSGRVIEIGAGNGLNFTHYPAEVTSVLAIEPEPHLRALAQRQAERAVVPVEVVDGLADDLPTANASFDAAVASLVLCSVPDQRSALSEVRRAIKPGGGLRFFEHVQADSASLRRIQRLLDLTVWPFVAGGCHAGRDTLAAIETAGFQIERLEMFRFPDITVAMPTSPHILGAAIRS